MKTQNGNGVVKSVADRKLTVVEDSKGNPTAQSEGYFTFEYPEFDSFDEAIAYFEAKDPKTGKPANALTVKNEKGETVYLNAEQSITQIINEELKRAAKANAYQRTVAKFKPAEDPKLAFEKIVRTYMSMGLPEDMARTHAQAALDENERRMAEAQSAETNA